MRNVRENALGASVLVLNRFYAAIHVVNARRAFGLLFRELAEVIHLEEGQYANYDFTGWREISELRADERQSHGDWVRAVNFDIQVPRVIRLLWYERIPKRRARYSRRSLLVRDDHSCQYCGGRFPAGQLSIDHVVPRSRGGETSWENVVCSCLPCNVKKGGRTPQEARMRLIRKPSRPRYSPLLSLKMASPICESWRTFLQITSSSANGS